jgi:16S rRNA G966 N2-methylase RsmD
VEKNQLYYGDNLTVLREHIKDESVDLIYLDPPFNSRQDYNVLSAQVLSIEELLEGKKIDYPRYSRDATYRKAPKSRKTAEEQIPLGGEIDEPF